jgi:thymidylate kinase
VVNNERKKYIPNQSDDIEKSRQKKLNLIQILWPYVVWADNLLTIIIYKIFYRNKVIILDRYPYDMYMSFDYIGRGSKLLKKLFLFIPKADVHIIFFVEPEIAMKRKTDHTYPLQFYITQLERYKILAKEKEIEMRNTDELLDDTINFVMERINQKAPKRLLHELQRNK